MSFENDAKDDVAVELERLSSIDSSDDDDEEEGDDNANDGSTKNKVTLAQGVIKKIVTDVNSVEMPISSSFTTMGCLKRAFRVFRHPATRLLFPFTVLALNLLIYNEDPISYGLKESKAYLVGRVWNYFFRQWPPLDEGLWITLKVFSLFIWTIIGALLGKYLIHNALLRDCFELKLFQKDMGSWPIMAITTYLVVFLGSFVYNAIVSNHFHVRDGSSNDPYVLNDYVGIKEYVFSTIAATLCWLCDYFNVFVVVDSMLQDAWSIEKRREKYGCDGASMTTLQRFWNDNRKIVFYVATFLTLVGTFFYVGSDWEYGWFMTRKGHFGWNQYGRIFVCSLLIVQDVSMFVQDWDFPKFKRGGANVKILGCNERIGCRSRRFESKLEFNGKWINFSALIVLIVLDTNLLFNQVLYSPPDYGQLADQNDYVRNVFGPLRFDESKVRTFLKHASRYDANVTYYDRSSLQPLPQKFSFNYTGVNGTLVHVYCANATLETQRSTTSKVVITYEYVCYNVSERFNVKYVPSHRGFAFLSATPIWVGIVVCLCAVVYNACTSDRCDRCDFKRQKDVIMV